MINKSTIKAYACINKNTSIRQKSSSGGCYFALAKDFIEQGGIVYSARFNDGFSVEHAKCSSVNELAQFMGSKYAPSRLGNTFKEIKEVLEKRKKGNVCWHSLPKCRLKFLLKEGLSNPFKG